MRHGDSVVTDSFEKNRKLVQLGEEIKFNVTAQNDGSIKISGKVQAESTALLVLVVPGLTQKDLVKGLHWDSAEGFWAIDIVPRGEEAIFELTFSLPNRKNEVIPLAFRRAEGGEEIRISCDQWASPGAIFVHGGCVSRDTFEFPGAPPLAGYLARSSMVSAMNEKSTGLTADDLLLNPSAFQRRMVAADLMRQLPKFLAKSPFDFFFIDLIVERTPLGLVRGAPVTISPEFLRCGLGEKIEGEVDNFSATYFNDFRNAWKKLSRIIDERKVIVNRVFLAQRYEDGSLVQGRYDIDKFNYKLACLYQIIEEVTPNIRWLKYNPDLFVADSSHKWGKASYHYGKELHQSQIEYLNEINKVDVSESISVLESKSTDEFHLSLNVVGQLLLLDHVVFDLSEPVGALEISLMLKFGENAGTKNLLVSFDLVDSKGSKKPEDLDIPNMHHSSLSGIGWYVYISTHPGEMLWLRRFDFPDGVECKSIRLQRWEGNDVEILVNQVRVESGRKDY